MPIIFVPQPTKNRYVPLLFLHIPKCGGTSIEKSFLKSGCHIKLHDRLDNIGNAYLSNKIIYKCPSQHFNYEMLESILDFQIFACIFAVVRNPYSRLASEFRFMSGRLSSNSDSYPIELWVDLVFEEYQKNSFALCNHLRPQVQFIVPGKTKIFKLEDGIDKAIKTVLSSLSANQGLIKDDLPSKKILLFRENLTRKTIIDDRSDEELCLRSNKEISRKIKHFYYDDFKSFYPHDL